MALGRQIQLDCRTGRTEDLALSLKRKELDVVLTDRMPDLDKHGPLTVHPLVGSSISLFAAPPWRVDYGAASRTPSIASRCWQTPPMCLTLNGS